MGAFSWRGRAIRYVVAGTAALLLMGAGVWAQTARGPAWDTSRLEGFPHTFFAPAAPRRPERPQQRPPVRERAEPTSCAYPWSYSRGLRRCVCVRDGFSLSRGRCVESVARPQPPAERAPPSEPVEAADGEPRRATPEGPRQATPEGLPTRRVTAALVQECLMEAGYLKGEIRDTMTPEAWTAVWHFKQDHPHGRTPDGIANPNFQRKLFPLCPLAARGEARAVAAAGEASAEPPQAAARQEETTRPPPLARTAERPELDCLPDDLHRLLVATYGARRGLRRCEAECLAAPHGLSKAELANLESRRGVSWCRSCIALDAYLPLDEILRIERGANAQLCARSPARLPRWGQQARPAHQPYAMIRALYRDFPPVIDPGDRIAVVVGNRAYGQGLPNNEAAHSNAGAMYALLTEHMGHTTEDVVDLRDATLEDLRAVFGAGGELERRFKERPNAQLLIYYAGHATTSGDGATSYLLPSDAVAQRESRTGYPLSELYDGLRRLRAGSALLLLEAGFGRDHSDVVFPPNLPEVAAAVLPPTPIPGLTVIGAAERDQKTLDDPRYGVGLFTRYLIEGLAGAADRPPLGNGDRRIDAVELYAYTAHMVRLAARKSYGLLQQPTISRQGNLAVSRLPTAVR